ncbi:ABC-F family ATP-binding cassette domain-containing protein [Candidatus Saccharibacteria bacterium]|nr:ABC-F family ATP-binding cassette domain-containing protein [Candidatus Saccharibacteria bacterium]
MEKKPKSAFNFNLFVPDADDSPPRVRREQDRAEGTQLVATEIEGDYFRPVTINIDKSSVVAIIGDNVRAREEVTDILAGRISPRSGVIQRSSNSKIEYVEPSLPEAVDPTMTIRDYFYEGRGLLDIAEELHRLYELMAVSPSIIDKVGKLQEQYEFLGGWSAENEVNEIISGLNVAANPHDEVTKDTLISELSSGQTSKIIVGRALFSKAGIIIMNEPSVHLDVKSRQWLATYLQGSRQAVVIATSDMSFTESVANKVIEITETGLVVQCSTGLNTFLEERAKIINHWVEEAEQKREEVENWALHVKQLQPMARKSADMAQVYRAAQTRLERMQQELSSFPGLEIINSRKRQLKLSFESATGGSLKVLEIPKLDIAYESGDDQGTNVVDLQNLLIQKGDRLAIVGRNGSGKSTLLKVVAGLRKDMVVEGEVKFGPSIKFGYYSPYTELANEDMTLRDHIRSQAASVGVGKIMDYWGFGGNEYYSTKVDEIRYKDEQARAQLAVIMAKKPNLIILDEPTSYLTPVYREKLAYSLKTYKGTLMVVSHDPEFLQELGINSVLKMPEGKYSVIH